MTRSVYALTNIQPLINYITVKTTNPTPVRLHKALYFMWAYYAASYGQIYQDKSAIEYPQLLFNAKFQAAKYGPALLNRHNHIYDFSDTQLDQNLQQAFQNISVDHNTIANPNLTSIIKTEFQNSFKPQITNQNAINEIIAFLDDLITQCNATFDFKLIWRSQQDSAWQKINAKNNVNFQQLMDLNDIIEDYQTYLKK